MSLRTASWLFPAVSVLLSSAAPAQTPEQAEFFEKKVRPVLVKSCQGCHNAKLKSAGLDLSSVAGFQAGSGSGPIVSRDQPPASRLLHVINYEEAVKMPPTGKLKPEEITDLTAWVSMGAPWPGAGEAAVKVAPIVRKEFSEEQKSFWAWQPLSHPAPPAIRDAKWVQSPVDRFILAKLEAKGIRPAPAADKLTLLRRATFDLTGLPPSEKEIQEFVADQSPQAFEKVVDRLLASPRYGERWGRHWLDVSRYADSTGNDEDHRYPHAWRYRDYVIQAFNDDLPYDQFVKEQVAGDLLPPPAGQAINRRGLTATGFLALGPKALAQVDKTKMLYDVWDEQVDVTSKAFLGMTMACARCHDHKFDPIRSQDYYSMVGMFASIKSFDDAKPGVSHPVERPLATKADYDVYLAGQAKIALQKLSIEEQLDAATLQHGKESVAQVAEYMVAAKKVADGAKAETVAQEGKLNLEALNKWVKFLTPAKLNEEYLAAWHKATAANAAEVAQSYQKQYEEGFADYTQLLQKSRAANRKKIETEKTSTIERVKIDEKTKFPFFAAAGLAGGPLALKDGEREKLLPAEAREQIAKMRAVVTEMQKAAPAQPDMICSIEEDKPVQQKVLIRGDYNNPGEDAPKAVPGILTKAAPAPEKFEGSGRLQLAEWLTNPKNPMTARVMVNRMWQWHFGDGIVATPDNFGKMGGRPTHPELLDYLATQFMQNGWSIKKMHRTMMLSAAYQMASEGDDKSRAADPEGTLLSRFQRQRLDVEQIRDAMLAIDGTIDLTMGGTLQSGTGTDEENSAGRLSLNPETVKRRTVYLPLRRSNLSTLLNLFDFGDATTEQGKRPLTNVAPQALFMMNSGFVSERAKNVVQQVMANQTLTNRQRMEEMFLRTVDRKPNADEVDSAFTYMDKFRQKFGVSELEAWQSYCHLLFASNEFIYLD